MSDLEDVAAGRVPPTAAQRAAMDQVMAGVKETVDRLMPVVSALPGQVPDGRQDLLLSQAGLAVADAVAGLVRKLPGRGGAELQAVSAAAMAVAAECALRLAAAGGVVRDRL